MSGEAIIGPCWRWPGHYRKSDGRPMAGKWHRQLAHRWLYERLIATCPPGLDGHHRCHHIWCVNPWHLEWMTSSQHGKVHAEENRPAECPAGHQYTIENTYVRPSGKRQCRACGRDYYHRRKAFHG